MRQLLDGAYAGRHCLVNFAMVNHMLVKFRRRPGKDEQVMSLAGLYLGKCAVTNLFHRNNVDRNVGIVLLAPVFGQHVYKPLVELRQEVSPFGDLERLLRGPGALREKKIRAKRSSTGRQLQEVSARGIAVFDLGHLGDTLFVARKHCNARDDEDAPLTGPDQSGVVKNQVAFTPPVYCSGADSEQNLPVCCRQVKLLEMNVSRNEPVCTWSRNASDAIAPLRGSGIAGQMSQTAPPSTPLTASCPSAPQPLASSSSLSSWAVRMLGYPSTSLPFLAAMFANTGAQTESVVLAGLVNQK